MRVAYRDEYPFARCDCGWLTSNDDDHPCRGCGKIENPERLDRFYPEPTVDGRGYTYTPVPYENRLDARH